MATNKTIGIGIDLGTTNTCVAICKDGKIETIPNRSGEYLTPSWVAYTDSEVLIGKTAKDNAYKNFDRTLFGIKRIIGRKYDDPVVQEAIDNWKFKIVEDRSCIPKIEIVRNKESKFLYPEEISALLLREMKEISEAYLGEENITDAVITVPAYFNDNQRQATKDAAKIAGLNVLRLINEPTAAAVAYIYDKPEKKEQNILVYDLGGGTFDVSIVSVENNNVHVKATRGDTNLGGSNFDDRCISYFVQLIESKYRVNMAEAMKLKLLRRLQNQIERAKHELSTTVTSSIELYSIYNEIDVFEDLSRARFDDLNEDLYNKTLKVVEQCVKEAKLNKDDIDEIVLVGGSTRVSKIQEKLEKYFGKATSKAINQDQAVAHGAAILAAKLNGTLPVSMNIQDILPMSLGIETLNGEMNILIKRNSQIPTETRRIYTTGVEGEDAIRITILEGDSRLAKKNLRLGYFDLLNLPKNPSVVVTFKVDINGIVTVNATEVSVGIDRTINIALDKGRLSTKEIQILRKDSDNIKEGNKKWNLIKKERNTLETYLLRLKDRTQNNCCNVEQSQKTKILQTIKDTLIWMSSDEALILKNVKDKYTNIYQCYSKICEQ